VASTKSQSKSSSNGKAAPVATTVRDVGDTATAAARRARGPMLAAGAAAAGLAGGLALGSRRRPKRRALLAPRRGLLGVPIGPKSGALRTAELLRDGAKHLNAATSRVAETSDDLREIREQLDKMNRRSPLEVVLDGLTHRRGAHRHES
jgi:hypothetical protein